MPAHDLYLWGRQFARFQQDVVRDRDLADVVQGGSQPQAAQEGIVNDIRILILPAQLLGQGQAELRNAVEVSAGVIVAMLGKLGQGDDNRFVGRVPRLARQDVANRGPNGRSCSRSATLSTPTVSSLVHKGADRIGAP